MKKIIIVSLVALFGYLFIGIEVIYREDGKEHEPFIKKYPTTQTYFSNSVLCGTCDFKEYNSLRHESSRKDFRDLCYYRYGLEDISQCEDLFRY